MFAAGCSLPQDGREKEAEAVLKLADYNEPSASIVPYTTEKALALILDCGSYQQIHLGSIEADGKLSPPYNAVREAKEQSMPNIKGCLISYTYN